MNSVPPRVYSVGHSNRSAAEFLRLLQAARIACLMDVRSRPHSRRHPQFEREALQKTLSAAGIEYRWEGQALGGLRKAGPEAVRHTALREAGFRAFAAYTAEPAFRDAAARLLDLGRAGPTAIMCAEARPESCHRQFIADYLHCQGAEVVHLLGSGERRLHRPRPELRVDAGTLIYDRAADGQLGLEL